MSGEWRTITVRWWAAKRIAEGWTDDEMAEEFGNSPVVAVDDTKGAELLYLKTLHGQRRLREVIAELRGDPATSGCPPRLREVEVAYRRAGDDRPSQEMVAARMGVDPRTVRRYAGMSWSQLHAHMATRHPR